VSRGEPSKQAPQFVGFGKLQGHRKHDRAGEKKTIGKARKEKKAGGGISTRKMEILTGGPSLQVH